MQIISHRGYWKNVEEKNAKVAFERSFDLGFGTETDVRDCAGDLLISHDMPRGNEMRLLELMEIMGQRNLLLALNIKADGITEKVTEIMQACRHTNYFMFDMSIPDYIFSAKKKLGIFTGCSDYVKEPVLLDDARGVWLDIFESEWYDDELLQKFLARNKKICLVSPDLHKRNHRVFWKRLASYSAVQSNDVILCTDLLEEAREFFADEGLLSLS